MITEERRNLIAYAVSTIVVLIPALTFSALGPHIRNFGFVLSVLGIAAWLALRYRSGRPMVVPLLGFVLLGYLGFQYALSLRSPLPLVALEKVNLVLPLLLAFLFVSDSLYGWWKVRIWENALLNVAIIFSAIELLLAGLWYVAWWRVPDVGFTLPPAGYRIPGVFFGHANIMSGFLNLVAPLAIARLIYEERRSRQALWAAALGLFLATQFFASSRAGWISGAAGAAIVVTLIFLADQGVRTRYASAIRRHRGAVVVSAGLTALVMIAFVAQASSSPGHAPIASSRTGIWSASWQIVKESFLLGHGPASFSINFARETQIPPGFATSHAHNIWLQVMAETGLIGLTILLVVIFLLGRAFVGAWRDSEPEAKPHLSAYAGAGAALVLHQQADYLFESAAYLLVVLIVLALLYSFAEQRESKRIPNRIASLTIGLLLIPFLLIHNQANKGAADYWEGVESGRSKNWGEASEDICQAMNVNPAMPLYAFQCGVATAQESFDLSAVTRSEDAIERGLQQNDVWPLHWANLASLEWQLGKQTEALEHLERAANSAPRNAGLAMNLGWMYEQIGELEKAERNYLNAVNSDPWLALSGFLNSSDGRRKLAESQIRSIDDYATLGWWKLSEQDPKGARRDFLQALELDEADPRAHSGLGLVLWFSGQEQLARKHTAIGRFLDTSSPEVLLTASLIARDQGNPSEAAEFLQLAFDRLLLVNQSSSFYDRTYLRGFLPTDLVPQLIRGSSTALMLEELEWLAEYYEFMGAPELAEPIRRFVNSELRH